jgi:1-acyl-sn-glycerol-3-phosphate acyltransferase
MTSGLTTTTTGPTTLPRASSRRKRWPWLILSLVITCLGTRFFAARYISATIALSVWIAAELAVRHGINPLAGPWARNGTPRAEVLKILWPMWRMAFALNFVLTICAAHLANEAQWLAFSSLAQWIIFTSFGVLSAVLHHLAGTPANLRRYGLILRHRFFLFSGFGPFGLLCVLAPPAVILIKLYSFGDKLLIQRRARWMGQQVFRGVLWWLEFIGLLRVEFQDKSQVAGGTRLIVGNHISMFDVIATLANVDQCGSFVKEKYAKIPLLRQVIMACQFIPIDPECHESRRNAMMQAKQALLRGETLAVWPEGTRTKDGTRGIFQNGVFRLALETGADVVPAVFTSSEPLFSNGGKYKETKTTVKFMATCEPMIALDHNPRISPGRVLLARSAVENFFNERLSQEDIPEWMRFHPKPPQMEGA